MASLSPFQHLSVRTYRKPRKGRHRIGYTHSEAMSWIDDYLKQRARLVLFQMRLVDAKQKYEKQQRHNETNVPSLDDEAKLRKAKENYLKWQAARNTAKTDVDNYRDELIYEAGPGIYHEVKRRLGTLIVDTMVDQNFWLDPVFGKVFLSDIYDFILQELDDEQTLWRLY